MFVSCVHSARAGVPLLAKYAARAA